MPLFEYNCKEHGNFEKIKKISEREVANCPVCDVECQQQLSAPKMLNGGFYDKSARLSKNN